MQQQKSFANQFDIAIYHSSWSCFRSLEFFVVLDVDVTWSVITFLIHPVCQS